MRDVVRTHLLVGMLLLCTAVTPSAAQLSLDPAAIVVFPHILVDGSREIDTVVQVGNASNDPIEVRCVYEDMTPRCSGAGSCLVDQRECEGQCITERRVTHFRFHLTAEQPFGWSAARGRSELPLDGVERIGVGGDSNVGSLVPALGAELFRGVLRCVVVDERGQPVPRNVLTGSASIETDADASTPRIDAAQYQAIGFPAQIDSTGDELLSLGLQNEYAPCPGSLVLSHLYDGAAVAVGETSSTAWTDIALVPCSVDIDVPPGPVAQFLTYNEFAQRFSTSARVDTQFVSALSRIDTSQPQRSIFNVAVIGTFAGQTEIRGLPNRLIGVAIEAREAEGGQARRHAGGRIRAEGASAEVDVMTILHPPCIADCNGDGVVAINELLTAVGMALDTAAVQACPTVDDDGDGSVLVHELIAAVQSALDGCPLRRAATPTFGVTRTPTSPLPTPAQAGPDLTLLGIARGDDGPESPVGVDDEGRPIYTWPVGQGFTLIAQVRPGRDGRPAGLDASVVGGATLPSFQMIVSRPLGDGSAAVCDADPPIAGGVPAAAPFAFSDAPDVVAAISDLGCRVDDGEAQPLGRRSNFCTRLAPTNDAALVPRFDVGTVQFCLPIARAWAFPEGDTIVAARARNINGETGPPTEIVIRIPEQP